MPETTCGLSAKDDLLKFKSLSDRRTYRHYLRRTGMKSSDIQKLTAWELDWEKSQIKPAGANWAVVNDASGVAHWIAVACSGTRPSRSCDRPAYALDINQSPEELLRFSTRSERDFYLGKHLDGMFSIAPLKKNIDEALDWCPCIAEFVLENKSINYDSATISRRRGPR